MMEVNKIVEECYSKLPYKWKSRPWGLTDHGRKVLQTETELDGYLAAYGEMHIVKCRVALQNFPCRNANDEIRSHNFEIFDWGCGQGIATLTLLEFLRERNLLGRLNAITLIEPSNIALERAKKWVAQNAGPGVKVKAVEKLIPADIEGHMDGVDCSSAVSINLFSNILDIRSISLQWLAHKTASLANVNYMICIGPKFSKNTRIQDFCGYFNPSSYFSCIDSYCYGYTQKTNHPYGCETRCFVHHRKEQLNDGYVEIASDTRQSDDYEYSVECLRGIVEDKALYFFNKVKSECAAFFNVFIRPSIGVDTTDVLMTSASRGIVLVNICYDISTLEDDFKHIENIKSYIFNTHLKSIKVDSIINKSIYGCVKTALYFPNASEKEVADKIEEIEEIIKASEKEVADNNGNIIKDTSNAESSYEHLIKLFPSDNFSDILKTRPKALKYDYIEELVGIIVGHWHPYTEGDTNFRLTDRQKSIVRSDNNRLRVKGVAGCGKTQTVANRAVEKHLQTGDKVLILTFNISLIQYVRMRINQVPADFSTSKFEIANYHQFFVSMANRYSGRIFDLSDFDDPNYFASCARKIKRYKTIIIDEVQDFKTEWLASIITYFLTPDGTVSVFGDGEQNIYGRKMEAETKMPSIPTFFGRWNEMSERLSMRIINTEIASLSHKFMRAFVDSNIPPINIQNELFFETYWLKYWNVSADTNASQLYQNIIWILQEYELNTRDVVVMAESINILRDIEKVYMTTGKRCMTNFESAEEYGNLIYAQANPNLFQKDLKEIRRAAKTHFTTDTDDMKMSTIHSFKGWESKSVILILQPEMSGNVRPDGYYIQERDNTPALIYTALTRAKCNLFILNLGNTKYHSFFQTNIK